MIRIALTSVMVAVSAAALSREPATAQTKVSVGDGLMTFSKPQGWSELPDPSGGLDLIPAPHEVHALVNCGVTFRPTPLAVGQTQEVFNARIAAMAVADAYPPKLDREVVRFSAGAAVDGVVLTDVDLRDGAIERRIREGVIVRGEKATAISVVCAFLRPFNRDTDYQKVFQDVLEKDKVDVEAFLNSIRITR